MNVLVKAALTIAVFAVFLSGCSTPTGHGDQQIRGLESPGSAPVQDLAESAGPGPRSPGSSRPSNSRAGAPALQPSTKYTVPIDVTISANCLVVGGTETLRVHTPSRAAIAYLAYYANGTNGADRPWGQGYGGNDGGLTDTGGNYVSKWTVSPQTPTGNARVEVWATVQGKGEGFRAIPFRVETADAGC